MSDLDEIPLDPDSWDFFQALPIVVGAAWLVSAVVAGIIAESRGRSGFGFFVVSVLFLGPLGPGFALAAQRELRGIPMVRVVDQWSVRQVVEGRRRFTCPRCGGTNDIPEDDAAYDCWQCGEHRRVAAVQQGKGGRSTRP